MLGGDGFTVTSYRTSRALSLWFNFSIGLNLVFPWFCGAVIYNNRFETKENKIQAYGKIQPKDQYII